MKIVFREWLKDKTACAMLLAYVLVSIIYTVLNARVVILISNTISDLPAWKYHLRILILVCIINTILSMFIAYFRPLSIHHCFTTLNNLYTEKVLTADPDMFTKYSCAYVNTMAEYLFKIVECGRSCARFFLDIVSLIVTLISIYIVGGWMVIPVIIIHGIGAIIAKKLFHEYERIDKEANLTKHKRNQELENIVNGFAEVRSFNTQDHHRKIIHDYNDSIYKGRIKRAKIQVATNFSFETIDTLGLVAVIIYSTRALAYGMISQATAMSLVMYVFRVIEPISRIMDFVDTISEETAMAENYDKIVSYVNKCAPDGQIEMDSFNNSIELRNVSFNYESTSTILKNISMKFPKGKKIGICGVSGAGKSTLFKILNRFYDQRSGDILIDGVEVHNLTKKSYRRHIASVHQENMIFPSTIKMNVLYGNFNVPEYEMILACKKAKIYDFIMSLPDKFETVVGPRGLTLSGGQKQRIALARLFLSNPDIILLDEATSALDNESETFIQEAIDALEGKTIITIAHRLSTIRNSDIIYVMGPSGVLEFGTHDELMEKKGEYFKMNK